MNNINFLCFVAFCLVVYLMVHLGINPITSEQSGKTLLLCQSGYENACGRSAMEDNK